jgi:hypothetical protein
MWKREVVHEVGLLLKSLEEVITDGLQLRVQT